jgi:hypothetical protein
MRSSRSSMLKPIYGRMLSTMVVQWMTHVGMGDGSRTRALFALRTTNFGF